MNIRIMLFSFSNYIFFCIIQKIAQSTQAIQYFILADYKRRSNPESIVAEKEIIKNQAILRSIRNNITDIFRICELNCQQKSLSPYL